MGVDVRETEFDERHQALTERLTLLAGDPNLDDEQRELARAWRDRLEVARERASARLSVAFIAQVGRGKSTLITVASGLHLQISGSSPRRWSVLPVGDGRTTLGETRVTFDERDDILLEVKPIPADELRLELRLFVQDLWSAAGNDEQRGSVGAGGHAGEELYDLLRAWLVPDDDEDGGGPRKVLDQLARSTPGIDALESELLSRLDLEQRCQPLKRVFSNDEDGLTGLRETLFELMDGELADAPAPRLVQLHVPMSELGHEIASIIDTQGIDPDGSRSRSLIAGRSDLQARITDPDTMLILCSEFASAPDPVTMGLLEVLAQLPEQGHAGIDKRALRIIIVDDRDAPVGTREEKKHSRAREERIAQCQDKLRRAGLALKLPDDAIVAIDAREEHQVLREMLVDMATETREHRRRAWSQTLVDAEAAIASLRVREFAMKTREYDLRLWWAWDAALAQAEHMPVDGLSVLANLIAFDAQEIGHWTQLNAAIRRRGRYRMLNLATLGASGASDAMCNPYVRALEAVNNADAAVREDAYEAEAHKHLELRRGQFASAASSYSNAINQSWREVLSDHFASPQSDELWRWCQRRWGQGPGYVADVATRFRQESRSAALQLPDSLRRGPSIEILPPRPALFRLREVELKNFRGITHQSIPTEDTTVLVGDNGLGKTCWLEAIAAGIGALLPGIGAGPAPTLSESDVHHITENLGGISDPQPQLPMGIEVAATVQGRALTWSRRIDTLPTETAVTEDDALQILARQIGEDVRAHSVRQLPVLAYYGTQRLWPPELKAADGRREVGNRLDGYRDCLAAASNHRHMMEWMRRYTLAEVQDQQPVIQLRAIERAVVSCVEEAELFRYSLRHEELQLILRDGQVYPFSMLSDGYRNMVAMVADIAWRASVLNPQLGDRAPALAEGVVLIDEIDLHLHPRWQRRVLADLRRAFPKLQFVTTTHSPFIIQSLEPGQLVNLDPDAEDAQYADASPEDIAEHIMGVEVPQRSWRRERASEVAERYYTLLDQLPDADEVEVERLRGELDELLAPYAENQAFVAFLERKRALAEARRS